eukprot:UC1_evm1s575
MGTEGKAPGRSRRRSTTASLSTEPIYISSDSSSDEQHHHREQQQQQKAVVVSRQTESGASAAGAAAAVDTSDARVVALVGPIEVTAYDLNTLRPGAWLNDVIINAWCHHLACADRGPCALRVYAFNSFFLTKLRRSGYDGVRRWTKKVDIFSNEMLLVPVHLPRHWALCVVWLTARRLEYYDSLGGSGGRILRLVMSYLEAEHLARRGS